MPTLGTAGHVDHGKSTLVKALTGIDPDRLPEEKQREMTIDLGFASMKLPNGQVVSIVDVPGHEKFIKNMLAGVGGIDIAMLVVAADDGVMPQTREHLAIVDLLNVPRGLVVVTKCDRVDAEWLELVREDISATVRGTPFADAPLVCVSAVTGHGLDTLRGAIADLADSSGCQSNHGQPRLPVDRVFTLSGFGTVVTGTLLGGELQVGDRVEVLPERVESRVRSIQIHNRAAERAEPGGRTAVNLVGVERASIRRGSVVAHPGQFATTRVMDARLRVLMDAAHGIRSGMRVRLFIGTAETNAGVTVLDGSEIEPGACGWVRLRLSEPVVAARQDRFIIRIPSPSATLGGGEIVDPNPRTQRRLRTYAVHRLAAIADGSVEQVLLHSLPIDRPIERSAALRAAGLAEREGARVLEQLIERGSATAVASHVISDTALEALSVRLMRCLADYHGRFPLRPGMPKDELKQALRLESRVLQALVPIWIARGAIKEQDSLVSNLDFEVRIDERLSRRLAHALTLVRSARYAPPSQDELGLSHEEMAMLIRNGTLTRVSDTVTFDAAAYREMVTGIVDFIQANGKVSIGDFRDAFSTTRKYTMALFDHLDKQQVTRRVGDDRVLGPAWQRPLC